MPCFTTRKHKEIYRDVFKTSCGHKISTNWGYNLKEVFHWAWERQMQRKSVFQSMQKHVSHFVLLRRHVGHITLYWDISGMMWVSMSFNKALLNDVGIYSTNNGFHIIVHVSYIASGYITQLLYRISCTKLSVGISCRFRFDYWDNYFNFVYQDDFRAVWTLENNITWSCFLKTNIK